MARSWFQSEKKSAEGEAVGAVGFLQRLVAAAMGCFFSCFPMKDSHNVSPTEPTVSRDKNSLSSLFLNDDNSIRKGEGGENYVQEELDMKELKDEAKFLKACGTIFETPVEIRKASEKWDDIGTQTGEGKPKFNSCLSDISIEKLKQQKQFDDSYTPIKVCEEWKTRASSLEETPSSCMTDGHNDGKFSVGSIEGCNIQNVTNKDVHGGKVHGSASSSDSPLNFAPREQYKSKAVRFDCESDRYAFSSKGSSSESASQYSKYSGSAGSGSRSKPSPYPTPLKLTDGMQTPGTVFPAYVNDMAGGKTKIRSQYVYSILNPLAKPSEWNESEDEISDPINPQKSLKSDNEEIATPAPPSDMKMKDISDGKETENVASLSAWLKQLSSKKEDGNEHSGAISGESVKFGFGRTPGDRPILGMVAAHWNNEEMSHISAKWWDGNGIPNSTNKYKEDQKVSWHATPFEERLEKALSEDTFVSQRKANSGNPPVAFNDPDESDTAFSHIQSTAHLESVISC